MKKNLLALYFCIFIVLLLACCDVINAQSYPFEEYNKISEEDSLYLNQVNETKFNQLIGQPELGVVLTHNVYPENSTLDSHHHNKFIKYNFANPDNPTNILVIITKSKYDLTFYGDEKLNSLLEILNQDETLKKDIFYLLYDNNTKEAVQLISEFTLDQLNQTLAQKDWPTIFAESEAAALHQQAEFEQLLQSIIRTTLLCVCLLFISGVVFFTLRNSYAINAFHSHNLLSQALLREQTFDQKKLNKWLKRNKRIYAFYKDKQNAVNALQYFFYRKFIPKKIDDYQTINESQKQLVARVLAHNDIKQYFWTHYFLNANLNLLDFFQNVINAETLVDIYKDNFIAELPNFISSYPLEEKIMAENSHLLPDYELSLYNESRHKFLQNCQNSFYFASIFLNKQSLDELNENMAINMKEIISTSLKEACLKVDLGEVYKSEPIYQEIIENDFSSDDLYSVMLSINIGYFQGRTPIKKLVTITKNAIIRQQDAIVDRKKDSKTIVRFDFRERKVKTIFRPKSR